MTARFCVFVEVEAEPATAMLMVLMKLGAKHQHDAGVFPSPIRVTGLRYEPENAPSFPGLIGSGSAVGYGPSGPSPLDEQNRLLAEYIDVAKKHLRNMKHDEDWKGEEGEP